jgi:hypothetical protein
MKFPHFIIVLLCFTFSLSAQQTESPATSDSINNNFLNVYLDGVYQYHEYIKTEIPYVNYVRDRFLADVHLLITGQTTGSGGTDYAILFLGQQSFVGKNDTLHFFDNTNNTDDERRSGIVSYMKMGLMPYIAKKTSNFPVSIASNISATTNEKQEDDKWNGWVFNVGGYGNLSLTSNSEYYNLSGDLSINKITEEWKLSFSLGAYYNTSNFDFGDGNIYRSFNNGSYATGLIANSISEHWSVGGYVDYFSSTYSNYDADFSLYPAIEYNVFPYSKSNTKLLTITYKAGPDYAIYTDTTVFNKKEELLFRERLEVELSLIQKWGSVSFGLNGTNYFHDFSKNSAGLSASINWSIVEGLSFNTFFNYNLINDQLNLPKGELTDEEILLQLTERQTDFSFYTYFGLTYTFGSIYNNVVNPRFNNSF